MGLHNEYFKYCVENNATHRIQDSWNLLLRLRSYCGLAMLALIVEYYNRQVKNVDLGLRGSLVVVERANESFYLGAELLSYSPCLLRHLLLSH